MSGRFVISLDFELLWGVRDHLGKAEYGDAILGARAAIPQMLTRFAANGVRATWATVGLLFCRTRAEMRDFSPDLLPRFAAPHLSPYAAIGSEVGQDEAADPYHFGRSLLERIIDTVGQEVGTHTYAHFCWLEEGGTGAAFGADVAAARRAAAAAGVTLQSIVFPRNQYAPDHLKICAEQGLRAYRGTPPGPLYRPRPRVQETLALRGARFLDLMRPAPAVRTFGPAAGDEAPRNVPASRFLRPRSGALSGLGGLHLRALLAEMRHAAQQGRDFHLWWHPHNFGRNTGQNLAQMDLILLEYRRLHDTFGFRSRTMAECADEDARAG